LEEEKHIFIYPNPFRNKTTISYTLALKSDVRIEVLNELVQLLKIIVSSFQPAGTYLLDLTSTEFKGIYFMKITIDGPNHFRVTLVKKVVCISE
jgi:hypothetical protein